MTCTQSYWHRSSAGSKSSEPARNHEIELYEIKLYDDLVMAVNRVGGGHKGRVSKDRKDDEPPERTDQLYNTIHSRLLAEFPGTKAVSKDKNP